jgi:selenocysteine-specific elongation factor
MSGSADLALHAVVGTAGHIDHGKSSLVKNLTGTDPDRLKEERERGLTIDLGYAELRTSDGREIGLIDVPGHERFVRNMAAGAAGLDVVMLVVAADDGVMPQTREHLDILGVLGVRSGFVVLTKIDLADADTADLAELDVREATKGTFLEDAPILRCSNATGEGIDAIRREIERRTAQIPPRDANALFRMPIQRSFAVAGHGTVVTGVPVSGLAKPGDVFEVLPGNKSCRVRGVQVHHKAAEVAGAGRRTALNLADVGWKDVSRGDVVCTPGYFQATKLVEARFFYLASWDRPLATFSEVKFHVGCAETTGKIVFLNRAKVEPGEDALAQIRLDEEVVVAPGDRFLARLPSPEKTLGGGVVLGETRFRHKPSKTWVEENLAAKEASLGDKERYVESTIRGEGLHPTTLDRLPILVHQPQEVVAQAVKALVSAGAVVEFGPKKELLHREAIAAGARAAEEGLLFLHEKNRYAFGFEAHEVASAIRHPTHVTEAFLAGSVARKAVERQGAQYRLKAFKGGLSQEDRRLIGQVEERLKTGGFAAPSPAEMAKELDRPEKRILNLVTALEAQKLAKTIADGVVLHAETVREARRRLVEHCLKNGELTSNYAKDLFGATRKYVIPLLEYFDAAGLTIRKDSSRVLKPGYEEARTP